MWVLFARVLSVSVHVGKERVLASCTRVCVYSYWDTCPASLLPGPGDKELWQPCLYQAPRFDNS